MTTPHSTNTKIYAEPIKWQRITQFMYHLHLFGQDIYGHTMHAALTISTVNKFNFICKKHDATDTWARPDTALHHNEHRIEQMKTIIAFSPEFHTLTKFVQWRCHVAMYTFFCRIVESQKLINNKCQIVFFSFEMSHY